MLIHLPIALFVLAFGFDVLTYVRHDPFFDRAQWWLLSLAVLTTISGVASGYLADGLVHWPTTDHLRIERMEKFAWLTLAAGSGAWLFRGWSRRAGLGFHIPGSVLLLLAAILITLTSRIGGELVFHPWLHTVVPKLSKTAVFTVSLPVLLLSLAAVSGAAVLALTTTLGRRCIGATMYILAFASPPNFSRLKALVQNRNKHRLK